ncbi:MAG: serine hydrolase [Candidatus Omnitrophota bacterium]
MRVYVFIVIFTLWYVVENAECLNKTDISAECAVIMDAGSGMALFEKNPKACFPPASTAKVMTAIVAVEKLPLDTEITVSPEAAQVEPVLAGLHSGVKYTLKDLLAGILIRSGNDAAQVIAEGVAGTEEKFSLLMNEKAKKIGMKNTYFANASGLPTGPKDTQYTTAEDLSCMMDYALKNKIILDMMSTEEKGIRGSDGQVIILKTHNRTLFSDDEKVIGKTGYTKEAKRTFVGVDSKSRPRIIIAVLQCTSLWKDVLTLRKSGLEIYEQKHQSWYDGLKKNVLRQLSK